jgi:hypothetical protein
MDEKAALIFFGKESKIHLTIRVFIVKPMKINCREQNECILLVPHLEEKDQPICTFWVLLSVLILQTDETGRNGGGMLFVTLGL